MNKRETFTWEVRGSHGGLYQSTFVIADTIEEAIEDAKALGYSHITAATRDRPVDIPTRSAKAQR